MFGESGDDGENRSLAMIRLIGSGLTPIFMTESSEWGGGTPEWSAGSNSETPNHPHILTPENCCNTWGWGAI